MLPITVTPAGVATLPPANHNTCPRLDLFRSRLRPPLVAPGATLDAGYLRWREEIDASGPRSLAIAAIGRAVLEKLGARS